MIATRGRTFVGLVVADRMAKTVTVEWDRKKYIPKFERYTKRKTRVKAHNEINAKTGDMVRIMETRPISKTKNFIVTEILGKGEDFGQEVKGETEPERSVPKKKSAPKEKEAKEEPGR